ECGLSGARRPHDGDVLVAADGEVHAAQRLHDFTTHVVLARDSARHDDPVLARDRTHAAHHRQSFAGGAERDFALISGHAPLSFLVLVVSVLVSRTNMPSLRSRIAW